MKTLAPTPAAVLAIPLALTLTAASLPAQAPRPLEHRSTFHEAFGFIQTVRELADGRVMVADPLGGLLVALDLQSGAMDPVGREGGGPGEWRQPDAVFALPGDSTLVVDLGNTRLSVFDPAGMFVRSYPIVHTADDAAQPRAGGQPANAFQAGMRMGMAMQVINPRAVDGAGRIYYQARGGMTAPGEAPDSLEIRRWDRGDALFLRIAGLKPPSLTTTAVGGGQVRATGMPLSPQDDWAVAPDGRVAVIRAEPYRVEWVHDDGRVVTGPAVDYRPIPVRTPEKQRYVDGVGTNALNSRITLQGGAPSMSMGRGGGQGPLGNREIDDYEWPAVLPAFRPGGAQVDPNGRVWVERYNAVGSPVLYDVFDRNGARLAQVSLPDGQRVIGFGTRGVYAVRVDDLGLHWLEVYAPPR